MAPMDASGTPIFTLHACMNVDKNVQTEIKFPIILFMSVIKFIFYCYAVLFNCYNYLKCNHNCCPLYEHSYCLHASSILEDDVIK